MPDTVRSLVPIYDIQHYLKFGAGDFIRITEINSIGTNRDRDEYETAYVEREKQATYVLGTKDTIEFEVDAMGPEGAQQQFVAHEDEVNVPVTYVRTIGYDFASGAACPATAHVAKQAAAVLNVDPLGGESGEPIKITGTINVTEQYTAGTFNPTTKVFTASQASSTNP